ncbi:alpha/beta-hydrolase [Viridothelium virens]|uniref:Alpha/beta-hydrolase n=1 Tax=Viridothelium virens TaxID=1048519 RepID=A0A6A6HL65_VIRVR|nr:alpha/beta-hydrolase [Viridothelium virens]
MAPTPFQISVPDEKLQQLKAKLELATFPDELDDAGWSYGSPLSDVKRLVAHWRDNFDWRKAEARLNQLPQFKTKVSVDGFGELDIHFVHQRSDVDGAVPLLFCHGWPGSFDEVSKLLSLLKGDSKSPAFHVVAPSLPNFGFSEGVKKKGFAVPKYAETLHKLMLQLGYDKYVPSTVTQGGDWGWFITRLIALHYPSHSLAHHVNMVRPISAPSFTSHPLLALQHALTPYSAREQRDLARGAWFRSQGWGYGAIQSTKPQTLGYNLADSPVGLLAWIYEKLHDWTDDYPWTDDEVCAWVSIYWFSAAGPAASVRIYYESQHEGGVDGNMASRLRPGRWIPHAKVGLLYCPKELDPSPRTWGRTLGHVVHEKELEHGGHFAAWEHPEELAGALNEMFGRNGPCFGIVPGRNGYATRASL